MVSGGYKTVSVAQIRKLIRVFNENVNSVGFIENYLHEPQQVTMPSDRTFLVPTELPIEIQAERSLATTSLPPEVDIGNYGLAPFSISETIRSSTSEP